MPWDGDYDRVVRVGPRIVVLGDGYLGEVPFEGQVVRDTGSTAPARTPSVRRERVEWPECADCSPCADFYRETVDCDTIPWASYTLALTLTGPAVVGCQVGATYGPATLTRVTGCATDTVCLWYTTGGSGDYPADCGDQTSGWAAMVGYDLVTRRWSITPYDDTLIGGPGTAAYCGLTADLGEWDPVTTATLTVAVAADTVDSCDPDAVTVTLEASDGPTPVPPPPEPAGSRYWSTTLAGSPYWRCLFQQQPPVEPDFIGGPHALLHDCCSGVSPDVPWWVVEYTPYAEGDEEYTPTGPKVLRCIYNRTWTVADIGVESPAATHPNTADGLYVRKILTGPFRGRSACAQNAQPCGAGCDGLAGHAAAPTSPRVIYTTLYRVRYQAYSGGEPVEAGTYHRCERHDVLPWPDPADGIPEDTGYVRSISGGPYVGPDPNEWGDCGGSDHNGSLCGGTCPDLDDFFITIGDYPPVAADETFPGWYCVRLVDDDPGTEVCTYLASDPGEYYLIGCPSGADETCGGNCAEAP